MWSTNMMNWIISIVHSDRLLIRAVAVVAAVVVAVVVLCCLLTLVDQFDDQQSMPAMLAPNDNHDYAHCDLPINEV